MTRFTCVRGSNRQSEHVKSEHYKERKPGNTWYVYWRCGVCHHTWITDAGTAILPDYKKEV